MPSSVIETRQSTAPRRSSSPSPARPCSSALRDTLGLTAAKRGCGVGTCGTCTCHVDGAGRDELPDPGRDDQRLDRQDARGHDAAPTGCRRSSRRSWTTSPPSAASARPGMIMAAEALLADNPNPTREDVVTAISGNVCRCTGYESIIEAILTRGDRHEHHRQQQFDVVGKPVQRLDALGHVTGRTQFFEDYNPAGLLHLKMHRSERHHANIVDGGHVGRRGGQGRREGPHAQGRPEQLVHDPHADQRRLPRRAGAGREEGPLVRRADRGRRGDERARRPRRRRRGQGHLRGPGADLRRRRGDQARRVPAQAARHELLRVRGPPLPARALRRRGAGLRRGRPHLRVQVPVAPDRAGADGDDGLHRRAQARRPPEDLLRHAGVLLHARQHGADPRRAVRQAAGRRRHGRRRLRRQGRRDRGADRVHRRDGDRQAGQVRLRPLRGDADLLPARGRADLHQGRRDERRADRRPPGHALRGRRRVQPPQPVRGDQGRRAHARPVHDPERPHRLVVRLHQPHAVVAPCAASA